MSPSVPSNAGPHERPALAAAIAEEEARIRRLEAEHIDAKARLTELRAKVAALDEPPVARLEPSRPLAIAPRSPAGKVKLFGASFVVATISIQPASSARRPARPGATINAGKSAKSVNNYLTILRKMLSVAQEWGLIAIVPKVKWLTLPPTKFDFLSFEEADRFLVAADVEWRAMITVALKTGMRQGELLALTWDDVDLVAGRVVVSRNLAYGEITTPKNGKTREIPLGNDVLAALKRHRHLRGEFVFCKEDGSGFTKGECKHPLWRACKRAGLRRIGWHVPRHTFASHLVMRGAVLKSVQELLGHSTIKMTERHAHLSPDVRKDAVRLLDHVHIASMGAAAVAK